MVTHIHPARPWFTCRNRPVFNGSSYPVLCPESNQDHPSAQSPFARPRCYLGRHGLSDRVSGRYPTFIAHTDSCARPIRSHRLRSSLFRWVFAACRHSLRRIGPSRRYLCESFSGCLDPYPGGSSGAFTRFFPEDIGLYQPESGSALNKSPYCNFCTEGYFGAAVILLCSGLQICSPPRLHLPQSSYRTSGQPWLLLPRISRFVTSPSSGYASRPNRAIDGVGTFTPLDSQPCRLLPQATPVCTCPARRSRWCPRRSP